MELQGQIIYVAKSYEHMNRVNLKARLYNKGMKGSLLKGVE